MFVWAWLCSVPSRHSKAIEGVEGANWGLDPSPWLWGSVGRMGWFGIPACEEWGLGCAPPPPPEAGPGTSSVAHIQKGVPP